MSSRHSSGEDLVTPCVSLLNSLALHTVNNTWVDAVWDGQFTESQELPADYEEVIQGVEVRKVLAKVQELTINWIKVHGQEETSREEDAENTSQSISLYRAGFWTIMTEQNIKYKVLVAGGGRRLGSTSSCWNCQAVELSRYSTQCCTARPWTPSTWSQSWGWVGGVLRRREGPRKPPRHRRGEEEEHRLARGK
eukprot:GFUD01022474.1.p1 GENE.GFUD01022474.1~~GFUD01022474.1.p1  ORF type:complete len:194 (+),score=59.20 GFUD01022474.1:114-695(+)